MTAERDTTRIVRSWLRADEHESADRVLQTVLARLDTTPQRRSWWPAWRSTPMNTQLKVLIAAAAVVVLALVGYQLLPKSSSIGGPSATPTAAPTPTAPVTPPPTQKALVVPSAGPLAIGRHDLNLEGVHFTFGISTEGWASNGEFGFDKGDYGAPDSAGFIVWEDDPDGVFSNPCGQVKAPKVGPTPADMIEAISTIPGVVVVEQPTIHVINNVEARKIVVRMPDPLPCPPNQFYLWYDETIAGNARYASGPGYTIRVWIFDYRGKRLELDAETIKGANPAIGTEVDDIVRSIEFD